MSQNTVDFLFLLDTSGSMFGVNGEKALAMQTAAANILSAIAAVPVKPERRAAVITYSTNPTICVPFMPVSGIVLPRLEPYGTSSLTKALALAKTILTNDTVLFLISDGRPDDNDYLKQLSEIPLLSGVYAVPIGFDADMRMLEEFTYNRGAVMLAYTTDFIGDFF